MDKQLARYTSSFKDIHKIILPSHCLNKVYKQMRVAGLQQLEAVALFAGAKEHHHFHILDAIIAGQVDPRPADELSPVLPAAEIHRIRCWLKENAFQAIAQIHSQAQLPSQARKGNQALPLLHLVGSISIVVPDFARVPSKPEDWAFYRLAAAHKWIGLDKQEVCHFFQITY
jgi:hypothetical protein